MFDVNRCFCMCTRYERALFYTVTIIVAVLLSTSHFLPMIDLPQHGGQVGALKAIILGEASPDWKDNVTLNYLTTYWVAYLSALLLSFIMPVNYAINTVVGLAFLCFVVSFSVLRKRLHSPKILDWVLLPTFFGFSYSWGFITFISAIPIGVLLIIQNLNWLEYCTKKYLIRVILCGVLLYFSHTLVFLFFCLVASCMTIFNKGYSFKFKLKQLLPFYFLSLLIPLFFLTSAFFANDELGKYSDQHYNGYIYGLFSSRLAYIFLFPWSSKHNLVFPLEAISIILLFLPFLMGYKLSVDYKKYVPFIIFLIIWFSIPEQMVRTALVAPRFSIFLFPFYILMFENAEIDKNIFIQSRASVVWLLFICLLLSLPIIDLYRFDKGSRDFRLLLEKLPQGEKALGLVYDNSGSTDRQMRAYVYFPAWYQALKKGWVDFNFAWFPPQAIRFREGKLPEAQLGFAWNPQRFAKFKNCNLYDLLIVKCQGENCKLHEDLMKESTCSHRLTYKAGDWFLYSFPKETKL